MWLQDWLWSDDSVPGLFIYSPLRMAPLKSATLKCKLLLVRNEANLADTLGGLVCSEPLPSRCDVRVGLKYEWYDDIEGVPLSWFLTYVAFKRESLGSTWPVRVHMDDL